MFDDTPTESYGKLQILSGRIKGGRWFFPRHSVWTFIHCVVERTLNVLRICQVSCIPVTPIPVLLCRTFPIQKFCVYVYMCM